MSAIFRFSRVMMLAALIFCGFSLTLAQAQDTTPQNGRDIIGTVLRIQGQATAIFGTNERTLQVDAPVYRSDTLATGPESRLRVRLSDGADLTLGENALMLVSDLLVAPSDAPRGPVMSLIKGVFALASPKTLGAEITTPVATIGIRGTTLWGGSMDTLMDVLLIEGKIDVFNDNGRVTLDQEGQGTTITDAAQGPTDPSYWHSDKVRRAVATVTFAGDE